MAEYKVTIENPSGSSLVIESEKEDQNSDILRKVMFTKIPYDESGINDYTGYQITLIGDIDEKYKSQLKELSAWALDTSNSMYRKVSVVVYVDEEETVERNYELENMFVYSYQEKFDSGNYGDFQMVISQREESNKPNLF